MEVKDEGGNVVRVTASFGVASLPDEAETESELLGVADKRMYRAKSEGRNKVVMADS